MIKHVILDFDGTLTNVDEEAINYVIGYKEGIAQLLGGERANFERSWAENEERIKKFPSKYGWESKGKIVAPAYADPLVTVRTIANVILRERGMSDQEREDILYAQFRANYPHLGVSFKVDTDEFLNKLKGIKNVCIVTNSASADVEKKVAMLPSSHVTIPIYGGAKKYELDSSWEEVPESLTKEGFGRLLFLRRKLYGQLLERILSERETLPEEVAVVGDIYEFDLLLPQYIGMHTILVPREQTPEYERNAVRNSKRGFVASSLDEVYSYIEQN